MDKKPIKTWTSSIIHRIQKVIHRQCTDFVISKNMTTFISKENKRAKERVELLVSDWYDVTVDELVGNSKNQEVVRARFICFFLLKRDFNMHVNLISALYKKDHSTVSNGLKRVRELQLWKDVREIESYPQVVLPLTVI